MRVMIMRDTSSPPASSLVDCLLQPKIYPDAPHAVDLVETHISWVFLTDRYAYKLKKPVTFDFLDFSTPESRRQACEDELRLNRRLTSDVYLEVVPVRQNPQGEFSIRGTHHVIDYLVKMRRLPEDKTLERLVLAGRCQSDTVTALTTRLADFYLDAAPVTIRPQTYRETIENHVRANFDTLSCSTCAFPQALVRRVYGAQLRFLRLLPHLLDERVCDGRIIEGHGDLRPEHIYMERIPQIIDCIEFSSELRTLDVADELCFLAMECDRIGGGQIGRNVLGEYQTLSHDQPDERLLAFYKCYRATVRAKVAALRARQTHGSRQHDQQQLATEYLGLADQYASDLPPAFVIVVRGLMGTGKSTLAKAVADSLGGELIQTDVVRRDLFGARDAPDSYGAGVYDRQSRRQVYSEVFKRAEKNLLNGITVVLDGTFLTRDLRDTVVRVADRCGNLPFFVECDCPAAVAQERIRDRLTTSLSESEARPQWYQTQAKEQEPETKVRRGVRIDTTTALSHQLDEVLLALASGAVAAV